VQAGTPLSLSTMTAVPMTKTILVADQSDARLSAILAGHELVFARTLDEAKAVLAGRVFDLIAISVHFDESRMFDLLRFVRWQERHRATPVVCLLTADFMRHAIAAEGLEIAVKALGGTAYLDLKSVGNAEARSAIDELLTA
jgi:PleD family two-component response regulator